MKRFSLTLLVVLVAHLGFSQTDSLIFKNGNYIVGEIKSMDRGTLIIETDYSDADFTIEWKGIAEIYSEILFLINTTDGENFYGTINSTGPDQVRIVTDENETFDRPIMNIVYLKSVDKGFLDRLYAGIDLGFTLTKARNQRQFSLRSRAGYLGENGP